MKVQIKSGEVCAACVKEGTDTPRIAFVRQVAQVEGETGLLCMEHARLVIEILLFIAREGPQREEDIEQHLARFVELYPYPSEIA